MYLYPCVSTNYSCSLIFVAGTNTGVRQQQQQQPAAAPLGDGSGKPQVQGGMGMNIDVRTCYTVALLYVNFSCIGNFHIPLPD